MCVLSLAVLRDRHPSYSQWILYLLSNVVQQQPSFCNLVHTQPTDFIIDTLFFWGGGGVRWMERQRKITIYVYFIIIMTDCYLLTTECVCLDLFLLLLLFDYYLNKINRAWVIAALAVTALATGVFHRLVRKNRLLLRLLLSRLL